MKGPTPKLHNDLLRSLQKKNRKDKLKHVPPDEIHYVEAFDQHFQEIEYEHDLGLLFLGSMQSLGQLEDLETLGVDQVISVLHEAPPDLEGRFTHHWVEAVDQEGQNLMQHFEQTFEWIEESMNENHGVLVHCMQGMSRSATIVAAYLMRKLKIKSEEARKLVRESRRVAFIPNPDFQQQLVDYELVLGLREEGEKEPSQVPG